MSFVVGGVTLPKAPLEISRTGGSVKRSDFEVDGDSDIVVTKGKSAKTLTFHGLLYSAGVSKATLETTYIFVLEALKGTEVLLSCPDTRYDGYWVLIDFQYSEVADGTESFEYTLVFAQGSDYLGL
jgi:hypothetical protein